MAWIPSIHSENRLPDGSSGSAFWAARAHWYNEGRDRPGPRAEWHLLHKTRSFGASVSYDDGEGEYCLHAAMPWLFSIYWSWSHRHSGKSWERSFAIHHWGLWLRLGGNQHDWTKGEPWWWAMHLDIPDFVLGRDRYTEQILARKDASVYLPEGEHPVKVEITLSRWKRSRWPWAVCRRGSKVTVVDPAGIPVPGKGENSWDCGADAICAHSSTASTVVEAVSSMAQSVLETRNRYAGSDRYPKVDGGAP